MSRHRLRLRYRGFFSSGSSSTGPSGRCPSTAYRRRSPDGLLLSVCPWAWRASWWVLNLIKNIVITWSCLKMRTYLRTHHRTIAKNDVRGVVRTILMSLLQINKRSNSHLQYDSAINSYAICFLQHWCYIHFLRLLPIRVLLGPVSTPNDC